MDFLATLRRLSAIGVPFVVVGGVAASLYGSTRLTTDLDQLLGRATALKLGKATIAIASVNDLIAMKRAAGRPQDLLDIEVLEGSR
jgi:hypothetical protein